MVEIVDGLPPITPAGPERLMLEQFLDYFRVVLRRKAEGLSHDQLHTAVAPSPLTIGGLLRHMTLVEDIWFPGAVQDRDLEPWASAPWDDDHDWEFTTAPGIGVDQLLADYDAACDRSRAVAAGVASLDQLSLRRGGDDQAKSLRWIMLHMIEEYARHCGHADYLREAIDGTTGD